MLSDLSIIHRRKPHLELRAEHGPEFPLWSTCLRSLAFAAPDVLPVQAHDEVYQQHEAYRFLLEIMCGLHSPILGETEVFGQFKIFANEWVKLQPKRASLVQALLNDAKFIRKEYLSNLGTQSYGSWVRKNLKPQRVHVIGAGILAREILPYLTKQGRDVVLHMRDPRKVDFFDGPVHALSKQAFDHGALLIAAPIVGDDVYAWLNGRAPQQLFDLRETSDRDQVACEQRHLLHEIFAEIANTKIRLQPRLEDVRREILDRAQKISERSLLRPQGWDDLCA